MRARTGLAAGALLLGSLGCGGDTAGPKGDENGRLVFASAEQPGDTATALFVINADGSGRRRLTGFGAFYSPSWSPDGRKIAYRVGYTDIGVMNADGSHQTTVWHSSYSPDLVEPSWSPDSRSLVFARADGAIYTINADGSDLRLLANGLPSFQHSPAWSPDGSSIAFFEHSDIYSMKPDGSDPTLLTGTSPAFSADQLSWSPDGKHIAYRAVTSSGPYHGGGIPANLEIFHLDGSPRTVVISGYPTDPAWSPDGSLIAFNDDQYPFGIHLIHPDGTQPRGLTEGGVTGRISWAPSN